MLTAGTSSESLSDLALLRKAHGALRVGLRRAQGGQTRVVDLYQQGCLKARLPRPQRLDEADLVMINIAGGLTGDDREGAHRACGPGGAAAVTQQGAGVSRDAAAVTRHGTDVKQDAQDRDTEQFFRAVDAAVLRHCTQPSGLPLILAALPQHHHLFRTVSSNPLLMDEAIDVHPDALSPDALRERAWQIMQPRYLQRLAGLVESFGAAAANSLGSDDVRDIAEAAVAGRVETLLIEADRLVPGRIDAASGAIRTADLAHPEVDDLLDDLGEIVLRKGGDVIIVPAARMPAATGAAAIYRF